MARPRNVMVIDLDGLSAEEVRSQFPEVYQHVLEHVRPERDTNNEEYRRVNWWLFGRRDTLMRGCTDGLRRYIVTVGTAKHRVFQFLDETILPNNMLVAIGSDDGFILGTLSSRFHVAWAIRSGGWLGMGNDPRYSKSRCFDPFPFPAADDLQKHRIRTVADSLDRHRKDVLARHAHLTLTGLYNVLEKLRAGVGPDVLDGDDRRIFDDGLVLILKEYHDSLDQAVAAAYGWPADLPEAEVLARLVALNRARVREEAAGTVRWLRPDYQNSSVRDGGGQGAARSGGWGDARCCRRAGGAEAWISERRSGTDGGGHVDAGGGGWAVGGGRDCRAVPAGAAGAAADRGGAGVPGVGRLRQPVRSRRVHVAAGGVTRCVRRNTYHDDPSLPRQGDRADFLGARVRAEVTPRSVA